MVQGSGGLSAKSPEADAVDRCLPPAAFATAK
jgi:hypothetical protein